MKIETTDTIPDGMLLTISEIFVDTEEEKEMQHYAIQYAQDYPIKIWKNWKDEKSACKIWRKGKQPDEPHA